LVPRAEYESLRSTAASNRMTGEFGTQRGTPYGMYREFLRSPSGTFCNPPPWGTLAALDLGTGKVRWEVPLGTIPPLSTLPGSAQWGSVNLGGSVVTAGGLVFIGAAMDDFLRAFDIETGRELAEWRPPAGGEATAVRDP